MGHIVNGYGDMGIWNEVRLRKQLLFIC